MTHQHAQPSQDQQHNYNNLEKSFRELTDEAVRKLGAVQRRMGSSDNGRNWRCLLLIGLMVVGVSIRSDGFKSIGFESRFDTSDALAKKIDKHLLMFYRTHVAAKGRVHGPAYLFDLSGQPEKLFEAYLNSNKEISLDVAVELKEPNAASLKDAGFAVYGLTGNIATVATSLDRLPALAILDSVRRISPSITLKATNDRANQGIGAVSTGGLRQVSETGRGVVVGIIDTGVDFRHLDFTQPGTNGRQTRIKALLDMTVYDPVTVVVGGANATIDAHWNYILQGGNIPIGRLYTAADVNAALANPKPFDQNDDSVRQRDKNGHGTHVAGIAAGNGLAAASQSNIYSGIAPEADLVVVKANRSNVGEYRFQTTDQINALSFVREQASFLVEPFVVNMSYGDHFGPHDGTGLLDRAIDNLVNSRVGAAVCVAAGNSGSQDIHASSNVPASSDITLVLAHPNGDTPGFLELYYPGEDRFSVTVTKPNGTVVGPFTYDAGLYNNLVPNDSDITLYNTNDPSAQNKNNIYMGFKNAAKFLGSNPWSIRLHGDAVPSGGHFDAWTWQGTFLTYVDPAARLTEPGASRGAITVAAWNSRGSLINDWASFSSTGPTVDGRLKPDISAPGNFLYSAKSSDNQQLSFVYGTGGDALASGVSPALYGGLAGTSMSTPVVTGAVALVFQARPTLATDQVKNILAYSATHDAFTGPGWSPRFGYGKLNVRAALATAAATISLSANPNLILERPCAGCGSGSTDLEAVTDLKIAESGGVGGTVTSVGLVLHEVGTNVVLASGEFGGVSFFAGTNRLEANGSLTAHNIGVHYAQNLGGRSSTLTYTVRLTDDQGNQITKELEVAVNAPHLFLDTNNHVIALDSVTLVSEPFSVVGSHNFSSDQRTRVMIFTTNMGLTQPSSDLSVRAGGILLTVEAVGTLQGVPSISYVIAKLDPAVVGNVPLAVTFHGATSNAGMISISP